ncbi:hypothetical protein [Microtetraspora niveoalba]|uniref:hypothetical protein n=1 Tax=Microtetraspora niveoalba TaxID=46175 RepID=UPI000836B335|nr:hypothetical protein [Microtetraspora niveoalba]
MSVTKTSPPWYIQLTDGVYALGEAARHYRAAYWIARGLASRTATEHVHIHEGKVTGQPGPDARGWDAKPTSRAPHAKAVLEVERIHREHTDKLHGLYETAALLYASGAASAIRLVQAGETPARPVLPLNNDRRLEWGGLEIKGLAEARYAGAEKLAAAYTTLSRLLDLRGYSEELASQDYLADHEVGEMDDASAEAEGIADAAYAYGRLAEQAVHFVLIEPRRQTIAAAPTTPESTS